MIKNYFKVAWRNLVRYKGFTLLNVVSLTLGITFALLIGLWVEDEWQYNKFHTNLDDLYFIRTNADWAGLQTFSTTPGPLRDVLLDEIPEVVGATRLSWGQEPLLTVGNINHKSKGLSVDTDFLNMFSFPLIKGDLHTALTEPNSIVLTESLAQKLFAYQDPLGQSIRMNNDKLYTVTAVVEDVPRHSEIQFNWLTSWPELMKDMAWTRTWGNVTFNTYVQLAPDADMEAVKEKIAYAGKAKDHGLQFFLQPLADTYLYGNFTAGKQDGGRIEYIRLFSALAIFLLILACINFMNLATARSSRRAKEIGIRKTVGATRKALIQQFMGEVFLLSLVALFFSLFLAEGILNWFNRLFEKEIAIDYASPQLWIIALSLLSVTSFLAGSYPAFLLSGLKPVQVLKGQLLKLGDRTSLLRKGLVVFQFAISIFLIIGTMVIHRQIGFIQQENLGIDRKDLFYTMVEGKIWDQPETYKDQLEASPFIQSVAMTQDNPMNMEGSSGDLKWPGKTEDDELLVAAMSVGDGFIKTMGIELIAGRDFSRSFATDTSNYIVNEALVEALGLEDPIGSEIEFWNGKGKIIGVTKDYHFQSLHSSIRPMVLCYIPDNTVVTWIKPVPGKTQDAIAHVQAVTEKLNPGYPFEYEFADAEFAKLYSNETLTAQLSNAFGGIAVLISCLGLLGLATYSAERRRKEIGIRKLLGASVANIIQLMSKEFIQLILMALVIAIPLGWYLMQQWLQQFAYRIEIHWWYMGLAAVVAFAIAAFAVSFQSIRAAFSNPVDSLRNE